MTLTHPGMFNMKKLSLLHCALILFASFHTSVGSAREPRLIDQLDVVSDVGNTALSSPIRKGSRT